MLVRALIATPLEVDGLLTPGGVLVSQVDDQAGLSTFAGDEAQVVVLVVLLAGEVDADAVGQGLRQGLSQLVPVIPGLGVDVHDNSFLSSVL